MNFKKGPEFATNFTEVHELNKLGFKLENDAKRVDVLRNGDLVRSL